MLSREACSNPLDRLVQSAAAGMHGHCGLLRAKCWNMMLADVGWRRRRMQTQSAIILWPSGAGSAPYLVTTPFRIALARPSTTRLVHAAPP